MCILLIFALFGLVSSYQNYDGYHLIDIVPTTPGQVRFLHQLMIDDIATDFWEEPSAVGKNVRIMLEEDYFKDTMTSVLTSHGISYMVYDNDVGRSVRRERKEIEARRAIRGEVFNLDDFNTLADIDTWLDEQLAVCTAAGLTCTRSSLGTSWENRDIWLFTATGAAPDAPIIYLDATIHAREWISTATQFKLLNRLLTTYDSDPETQNFMNNYQVQFVPVVNPDGYEYTWTDFRLHRKNKGTTYLNGSVCNETGTDINRNFDYRWAHNGVSHVPCSAIYCGEFPGSEPETQALMAHIRTLNNNRTYAFVTFHSYGFDWMHAWGTTVEEGNDNAPCEIAEDHYDLFAVAEATALALETHGFNWDYGNGCVVIYATSGSTDDYAKGAEGIKYTFTPELRGVGFIIDPSHIELSYLEVWDGLVAMEKAIAANPPY